MKILKKTLFYKGEVIKGQKAFNELPKEDQEKLISKNPGCFEDEIKTKPNEDYEKEIKSLKDEISKLQEELNHEKDSAASYKGQVTKKNKQIEALKEEIETLKK